MRFITSLACLVVAACSSQPSEEISATWASEIKQKVVAALPNARVSVVCGGSKGKFLWLDHPEKEGAQWEDDGIDGGALAFLEDAKGPNIVVKDAALNFGDLRSDGAEITVLHRDSDSPIISTWVVAYRASGIVQTHNIVKSNTGQLVDIWTSNKPAAFGPPRAFLFISNCVEA
ncbi:MAG: hypothetical protein K2W91_13370 [Novosphingobium sp.]|nr:hypothetical protein [Novosphingobium sp.]